MNLKNQFTKFIIPSTFLLISLILFTIFYNIEEIVRGNGKVISDKKVQKISHLEGGIIEEIYVKENQMVKKGDKLLKIKNQMFNMKNEETKKKVDINKIKMKRLRALEFNDPLKYTEEEIENHTNIIRSEINIYNEKINQRKTIEKQNQIQINQIKEKQNQNNRNLEDKKEERKVLNKQFEITDKLYMKKAISRKEYLEEVLKKQRIVSEIEDLKNQRLVIKKELKLKEKEYELILNTERLEILKEIEGLEQENIKLIETLKELNDKLDRQYILSPVNGSIGKINNNTISGVVKKGEEIIEISPNITEIIIETEIDNRDRGSIYIGQKAKIDFSAFPYGDYGFIEGEIISISPNSFMKQNNNKLFYLVKVKTKEDNVKGEKILSGMAANVNIITGEKSILEYIIKPIKNIKNSKINIGEENE